MEADRDRTTELDESETEEEVTFLLRLRPTPSPPTRRRRHSVDCRPAAQGKDQANWDVIIQRREVTPPPIPPRALPSAPPPEEAFQTAYYPKQPPFYHQFGMNSEFSASFPNLKFIEQNSFAPFVNGNCMPLPPKPHFIPNGQNFYPNYVSYNGDYTVSSVSYQPVREEVFNVPDQNCSVNSQGCDLVCRPVRSPTVDRPKHHARPPASPPPPRPPKPAPRSKGIQTNPYAISQLGRTKDATDARVSVFSLLYFLVYCDFLFR